MNQPISKRMQYKMWRKSRPFWGATLSLLSGLIILWIPAHLYSIMLMPGNFAFIGLLFGGLIVLLSILGYFFPQFNIVFGILTIFLSVLSIMGALGGFLIGTILGIIGGSLSLAWKKEMVPAEMLNKKTRKRRKRKARSNTPDTQEENNIKEVAATGDSGEG
ncbi:MAG: DUF6114 domain-containing protein [Tuberibacillus sp.]